MAAEHSDGRQYRWVNDAPRRSQRVPRAHWDTHKAELDDLYHAMSLDDLMGFMKDKHGFAPTRRQYTYQFEKWGFAKYRKDTTYTSDPAVPFPDITFEPLRSVAQEPPVILETCEHAKRHRSMQSIQSSASGSASPLRPPAKRSRRDPQPESDTGTSSSAELTKDTGSDESCSPSFHASESMGDHAIQVNLMEVSHTAPPLRPDRGNLNSLPSFLCEADLQAPPPRPDRGNLNRLSSFVCEADLDAPSTSPEHCKDGNQRLDFPPRWESAEEISKTSRAITAQRPVSTYTAKDMDHIQLAAEYLEAMGYEEDAFSLYALLLKRLHQDCPQDKATFLQAIINYSRCVSTPGHCEIIQHHLRDQAQQLLEEVSSCLLYQFLIEMALAETYSRKFDRPGVKTHLRRARQLIQGDNGYDQVIKQLPQNSRGLDLVLYHSLRRACDPYAENLLPREDPKEFTSWEFDAHALERIPLYRVPGPFELRVGVMRNPCIRLCLEWCQQKLQQLKYVPGPWMEIVSLEKRAHKVRSTTAHRMFLFTCLWNIWVNESEASSSMSGADAWMSETHSRLGVNATELLMITCAQIVHESGPSQGLGTFRTELDLIYSLRRGVERLLRNFDEALARHFLKAFVEYRTLEEEEPQWLKDLRQRSRAGTMGQLEHALHTTFSQTQGFAAQLRRSTRRLSTQAAEVAKHMTMTSSIRSSDSSLLNFRKVKESMDERLPEIQIFILDSEPVEPMYGKDKPQFEIGRISRLTLRLDFGWTNFTNCVGRLWFHTWPRLGDLLDLHSAIQTSTSET